MSTALMVITSEEKALLRKTIASGTTEDQFNLFIQVCRQTGLNPFARQIYAVVRNEKQKDGSYLPKMVVQTSIDGYRLLAQRSGEYAGQDGPYWYDPETKEWSDVWLKSEPPAAAKVGVMRRGFTQPIYAVARFESYAARNYNKQTNRMDGELSNLWAKMPELMIAKVAEALALRRAFPAELSGVYTKEEMDQADQPMPVVSVSISEEPENSHSDEPVAARPVQQVKILDEQQQAIANLLEEYNTDFPGCCQTRTQKQKLLREALEIADNEQMPGMYTPDDVIKVEEHIKSIRYQQKAS